MQMIKEDTWSQVAESGSVDASNAKKESAVWKTPIVVWALAVVTAILLLAIFFDGIRMMVREWSGSEEYSHGFLIPVVAVYLAWQKRGLIEQWDFASSWIGFAAVLLGLFLYLMGDLATLYVIIQYGLVVVIAGIVLSLLGWQAFRVMAVSVVLLAFMIPLPNFLYQNLSSELQLISSKLGVWVIRSFGISVFLEGNVIDLGTMKLQVVEACNGLRYLFPLMTVGFIAASIYRGEMWKRALIFLSSIPITVFMNSFRIGVIGVTVEYWGKSMAEGFLHDFEGWIVFMASIGVLVVEMWILMKIGKKPQSLAEVFNIDWSVPNNGGVPIRYRRVPASFIAAFGILTIATIASAVMPERVETSPARKELSEFPTSLHDWKGRKSTLDTMYLDVLKLDDYILADFIDSQDALVNFYAAYYASQRKGESAHSPRSCIPGDGWQIAELRQHKVNAAIGGGQPLVVNRAVIRKGEYRQLVYYWFPQRGRNITNEYLVKWYLFYDALTKNRTDGALVRLTTPIRSGESIEQGDERLEKFVAALTPKLEEYIPR